MPADTDNPNNHPSSQRLSPGQQIGDYLIGELIFKGINTRTWSATQISVQREVILCCLADNLKNDQTLRTEFLADVRTKAAVDHPLIGSVLEAISNDLHCCFALEKLHGTSLTTSHDEGASFSPLHTVRIIRNIASACLHLENQSIATLPLSPHDIFVDDKHHCRIINMAVSGDIDPNVATRDKQLIGQLFQDLLEPGQPGSTRTGSLLDYMADLNREETLTWQQIHDLSDEVERQLTKPRDQQSIQSPTMEMRPATSSALIAKILSVVAVISIIVGTTLYVVNRKPAPRERRITDMVHIPAGTYPGPDSTTVKLRDSWIDAHEVTIGEYAKFLQALTILSEDQRTVYQHDDQPQNKISHAPDDWNALHTAAMEGGTWNNLQVDLNYPVVGVDWWDAYAYAEWKGRRLPTREEWYAACSAGSDPSKLTGTSWLPVDQTEKTTHGVHGMAGNVSEWMRKRSLDSADPSKPARYIICGSSYLRPKYGARYREWVDDRNLRRPDLGFRTFSSSRQDD